MRYINPRFTYLLTYFHLLYVHMVHQSYGQTDDLPKLNSRSLCKSITRYKQYITSAGLCICSMHRIY